MSELNPNESNQAELGPQTPMRGEHAAEYARAIGRWLTSDPIEELFDEEPSEPLRPELIDMNEEEWRD